MILGMPEVYWVWNIAFLVWGLYVAYKVHKIAERLDKIPIVEGTDLELTKEGLREVAELVSRRSPLCRSIEEEKG